MSLDALKAALPDYAKDIKLNLSNVLATPGMSAQQIWGTALASALASRHGAVIRAIAAEAAAHLSPQAQSAVRMAHAIMAMNNIYYRAMHLMEDREYLNLPAKLRMTALASHGVEALDFELWSLAVSAVNGCGMCLEAHQREVLKKGATREVVQNTIRIAAVVHAVAAVLDTAEALGDRAGAAVAA